MAFAFNYLRAGVWLAVLLTSHHVCAWCARELMSIPQAPGPQDHLSYADAFQDSIAFDGGSQFGNLVRAET